MNVTPNSFERLEDFQSGSLLLIDKPLGWTSFDVVNKVRGILRRRLGVKKLKVGHAGTLDPLATGLLVICTGRMTKEIQTLLDEDKGYTGTMTFGSTTPSYDLETEPEGDYPVNHLSEDVLRAAAAGFCPSYLQTAPIFSAKKVDGKPAYKSARKGIEVVIAPREVHLNRFELTSIHLPSVDFDVVCSKGTYIRSLAHDMGKQLGSGAHLSALRRYRSGQFDVRNAFSMEEFEARLDALHTENAVEE
jgi:tRNA pseudouridine55 synthase